MKVSVKLHGHLRKHAINLAEADKLSGTLELPAGAKVADVVARLCIDNTEVLVVDVNGEVIKKNALLADGDVVSFFPMVGGG